MTISCFFSLEKIHFQQTRYNV